MKKILLLVTLALCCCFSAAAQTATCPAGQHGICAKWTPSTSPIASQYVARSLIAGGENFGTPLCTLTPTDTSCLDKTFVPGVVYYYQVQDCDSLGQCSKSNEAGPVNFPTPPVAPTALTVTAQ